MADCSLFRSVAFVPAILAWDTPLEDTAARGARAGRHAAAAQHYHACPACQELLAWALRQKDFAAQAHAARQMVLDDELDELLAGEPGLPTDTPETAIGALRAIDPGEYTGPPPPQTAAEEPAGSELKIRLMATRHEQGQQCFHAEDAPADPDFIEREIVTDRNGAVRRLAIRQRCLPRAA